MTEPSDQAKRKALQLTIAAWLPDEGEWTIEDCRPNGSPPMFALARVLQEHSDVARAATKLAHRDNCAAPANIPDVCGCGLSQHRASLQSLILPDEPDPLAEALGATFDCIGEPVIIAQFKEELAKRGGRIVFDD